MTGTSTTMSADLTVPLPRPEAIALFTAEGERAWAGHGWDPRYPDEDRVAGPGTVFTTRHGHQTTTWVMVDHTDDMVRYARVTPDVTAGTVEVRVIDATADTTSVRVTYDLTALSADALPGLREFEARYPAYIASWERDIRHVLADTP